MSPSCACPLPPQTRYRTYRARVFLATVKQAQEKVRLRHQLVAKIQSAYRGMKGRQFYEVTKNIVALNAVAGPLQRAVQQLIVQEEDVRRQFDVIQKRVHAQEVRARLPTRPFFVCCGSHSKRVCA